MDVYEEIKANEPGPLTMGQVARLLPYAARLPPGTITALAPANGDWWALDVALHGETHRRTRLFDPETALQSIHGPLNYVLGMANELVLEEPGVPLIVFRLRGPNKNVYDAYGQLVVIAESEDEARKIGPRGEIYDGSGGYEANPWSEMARSDWARDPSEVEAVAIGTAFPGAKAGVISKSFNAG